MSDFVRGSSRWRVNALVEDIYNQCQTIKNRSKENDKEIDEILTGVTILVQDYASRYAAKLDQQKLKTE